MFLGLQLFLIAKASLVESGPPLEGGGVSLASSWSFFAQFLKWGAVFVFLIGIVLLVNSLIYYLIAAGEEPKMLKGWNAFKAALICFLGTAVMWGMATLTQ